MLQIGQKVKCIRMDPRWSDLEDYIGKTGRIVGVDKMWDKIASPGDLFICDGDLMNVRFFPDELEVIPDAQP